MTYNKKRKTLKDIAEASGVSEMTVSRVLRESGTVSNRTKEKVLAVVRELGYVQNRMAGSLATSRSNQVAVIIPSLSNHVFTEVMSGISEALDKEGYQAVVGISDYSLVKEEELVYSMMSWRPAGIIMTNIYHTQRTRNILVNTDVPVVEIMNVSKNPIDMSVGFDHSEAGKLLAMHLIQKGYRKFGYVGWNKGDFSASARFEAIETEVTKSNCTLYAPHLFERPPTLAAGKIGLSKLMAVEPNLDAVFFSNDTAASGGLMHCIENNIIVPNQLAIAGFSGLESGQNLPLPLTTIQTSRYEIGRRSARNILARLSNMSLQRIWDMGFELIEGQTS